MKIIDFLALAIKALNDRKMRSLLTILGITIGGGLIMGLIASSSGLSASVGSQVGKIGANTIIIRAAGANFVSGGQSAYQLTSRDTTILQHMPDVTLVVPYYSKNVQVSLGGQVQSGTLYGIDSKYLPTLYNGLSLMAGNYPSVNDPTSAVIGNGVAFPVSSDSQLISVNQAVSMKISGVGISNGASAASGSSTVTFLVKGILAPYGSVLFTNIDNNIYISFQAAEILLRTPYYSGFYVLIDDPANVANVQAAIQSEYAQNVNILNAGAIAGSVTAITGQMTIFLGSIAAVSLFVAAVGIMNTMFVAVLERTREIGVLKALGFKRMQIMLMFLSEAVVTGMIGGITGTGLGYVLSYDLGSALPGLGSLGRGFSRGASAAATSSAAPVFSTELILFSLLFPVLIAVLAGLYPAWRASRMNAITALKYE